MGISSLVFYSFLFTRINMPNQVRAMIDTNVYELLLEETNIKRIRDLVRENSLIVYGCKLVRDELRNTSKDKKIGKKNLRILLLQSYDLLVKNRSYPVGIEIEALAREYLSTYKGGSSKKQNSSRLQNSCYCYNSPA